MADCINYFFKYGGVISSFYRYIIYFLQLKLQSVSESMRKDSNYSRNFVKVKIAGVYTINLSSILSPRDYSNVSKHSDGHELPII